MTRKVSIFFGRFNFQLFSKKEKLKELYKSCKFLPFSEDFTARFKARAFLKTAFKNCEFSKKILLKHPRNFSLQQRDIFQKLHTYYCSVYIFLHSKTHLNLQTIQSHLSKKTSTNFEFSCFQDVITTPFTRSHRRIPLPLPPCLLLLARQNQERNRGMVYHPSQSPQHFFQSRS